MCAIVPVRGQAETVLALRVPLWSRSRAIDFLISDFHSFDRTLPHWHPSSCLASRLWEIEGWVTINISWATSI
jgi:hypothetical protein